MYIDEFRDFCLALPGVEESLPFGPDTLVFKVGGKVFALAGLENNPPWANLKCDPEYAVELREKHPETVTPGYHMNKKHWNSVQIQGGIPEKLVRELIQHSYELVLESLPKKVREGMSFR